MAAVCLLLLLQSAAAALIPQPPTAATATTATTATAITTAITATTATTAGATATTAAGAIVSRRRLSALAAGFAVTAAATPFVPGAFASGGATAGKTTSIPRAKTRYYGRITEAVGAFAALKAAAQAGGVGSSSFFGDDGAYSEIKTAGYLLACAFKIDSKIPPDRIEQVKKHKILVAALDKLKAASKDAASGAYATATAALNDYLESVELPPLGDARYA